MALHGLIWKDGAGNLKWAGVIVFLVLLAGCNQVPPPDELVEGHPFPRLALTGLNTEDSSISAFEGKLLIFNIWATWCAPCRKELPWLENLSTDPGLDVTVIGMSVDSDQHVATEYLLERGITFRNYIDLDMSIAKDLLGVRVFPDTFVISPRGNLIRRIAGGYKWDSTKMKQALAEAAKGSYRLLKNIDG
ncbi:MAG: TlpA family protein disulfide reductase [Gammaproteobacteria bacterium]